MHMYKYKHTYMQYTHYTLMCLLAYGYSIALIKQTEHGTWFCRQTKAHQVRLPNTKMRIKREPKLNALAYVVLVLCWYIDCFGFPFHFADRFQSFLLLLLLFLAHAVCLQKLSVYLYIYICASELVNLRMKATI